MRSAAPNPEKHTPASYHVVALVLICLMLLFLGLGQRALWDTDEGKHAATSKEMVRSGDWVVPRLNGEPFYDKPPLFTWLVATSFTVLGFSEFAARLPAALLGLGIVLLTYRLGRETIGPQASFLGAIVLVCSVEFVALSRTIVHDISLAFFVTLALLAIYRAYAVERGRAAYLMLAYAAVGFAILAKGPIGAVLPAGVVLVFLALRGELGFLRKMMILRGALLAALIALPWFVMIGLREPDYLSYFLLEKNFGSFVSDASRHPRPFYYYVPVLLVGFAPWSFYLPLALWRLARRRIVQDPARLFLLVWFGFVFVFFSAASSKLATYLLPLFPPAALLVGDFWAQLLHAADTRLRRGLLYSLPFSLAVVVSIVIVGWTQATSHAMYDPQVHRPHLIAFSVILIATVLASSVFVLTRWYRALFAATAGMVVAIMAYLGLVMLPVADAYRSTKIIAQRLDRMLPPDEEMAFFHEIKETALFYTDRRATLLRRPQDVEAYLESEGALCVIDGSWLEALGAVGDRIRIVDRHANKMIIESADR